MNDIRPAVSLRGPGDSGHPTIGLDEPILSERTYVSWWVEFFEPGKPPSGIGGGEEEIRKCYVKETKRLSAGKYPSGTVIQLRTITCVDVTSTTVHVLEQHQWSSTSLV